MALLTLPLVAIRLLAFVLGAAVLVLAHMVYHALTGSIAITQYWHKFSCWLFGIRVHTYGTPAGECRPDGTNPPVLYVSNHVSYLDVSVLGSLLNTVFVAKSEVRDWPIFGVLTNMQKTVYIRRVRTAMEEAITQVQDRLTQGYDVVLFPEGTSSNGQGVMPFKPSFFELAYAKPLQVQPVSIVIEAVNGQKPNTDDLRNVYAWWRPEDTLMPHLIKLAGVWRTDIGVHFHAPLDPTLFDSRKALAEAAQQAVANPLN